MGLNLFLDSRLVRFCAFVGCILMFGCIKEPPMPGAFYKTPQTPLTGKPGDILRQETFAGAPKGSSAYRVLYISTGMEEEAIAVSGTIIIPKGPIPAGRRNIVAWAHPTTGVATRCAPSLRKMVFASIPGLKQLLADDYVIAVTDYPGLGAEGVHPYLVGVSEGRAVLDSVRAAQNLPAAGAGSRFAVWGHSQGGHAALFAGELAESYAPELMLVGVAAAAPATDLAVLLKDDINFSTGKILTSYSIWSWSRVFQASTNGMVDPKAIPAVDRISENCVLTWGQAFKVALEEWKIKHTFLIGDPTTTEPWKGLFAKNSPGKAPAGAPVFIAQGTSDVVVRPVVTAEFVNGLCANGTKVRFLQLSKVTHLNAATESSSATIEWIAARFAGDHPPDDCPSSLN
jgi:acetyl esterase/lipase